MPSILNGTDMAPSPPEFLLHTLASCITTSMMLLASANGIEVDDVTIRVEGDLNLNGFLGLDACILEEYEQIKVSIDLEGNLTEAEKRELLKFAKKSPIYNTILNPGAINIALPPKQKWGIRNQMMKHDRSIDHILRYCVFLLV